jgi:CRISPR/Cas system-associated exonuclease Cas4 (RecB family)
MESNSAPKLEVVLPEYHQSAINMFLKCPRQYMFRYMMGLRLPPKSALTIGRAVDNSFSHNMTQKIESKIDLPVDDVTDAFSTSFDKEAVGTVWDGDDPGEQKDMGVRMARALHEKAAPSIQPVSVQESFRIETDAGYALGGTFDVVQEGHVVRDQKTSKGEYAADAVQTEIQPAVYSFAYEAKHGVQPEFAFDVVTKHKKEPRYQIVRGRVSQVQTEQLFEAITIMHAQIQRGEFQYAAPGSWWCSKSWCGYWDQCKGKK